MTKKITKGLKQFRIESEPGNMLVTSKLSKKEFVDRLQTNRLKPYTLSINHKGAISNNIFNPYN